eukprot:8662982-Pyramimonas_sp.AAC.1
MALRAYDATVLVSFAKSAGDGKKRPPDLTVQCYTLCIATYIFGNDAALQQDAKHTRGNATQLGPPPAAP